MKLVNKDRKVKSKKLDDRQWILPPPETDGPIEEESSGKLLSVRQKKSCAFGKVANLQDRGEIQFTCKPESDSQRWFRSKSDDMGYFTIKNIATGQLLTAKTKTSFILTGMLINLQELQNRNYNSPAYFFWDCMHYF